LTDHRATQQEGFPVDTERGSSSSTLSPSDWLFSTTSFPIITIDTFVKVPPSFGVLANTEFQLNSYNDVTGSQSSILQSLKLYISKECPEESILFDKASMLSLIWDPKLSVFVLVFCTVSFP
jgi:hypothetical protein